MKIGEIMKLTPMQIKERHPKLVKAFALLCLAGVIYPASVSATKSYQVATQLNEKEAELEKGIMDSNTVEMVDKNQQKYRSFNKKLISYGGKVSGIGEQARVSLFTRQRLELHGTGLNKELLKAEDEKSISTALVNRERFNKYLNQAGLEVVNISDDGEITIAPIKK